MVDSDQEVEVTGPVDQDLDRLGLVEAGLHHRQFLVLPHGQVPGQQAITE